MNVIITPGRLSGCITPPPSKSQAHRVVIAAALAGMGCGQLPTGLSQDIDATMNCMAALAAAGKELPRLDCGESGSTLRFLIPVALAVTGGGIFTGRGRLMDRPQQPYFDLFKEKGIFYEQKDGVLTVKGELKAGVYRLPGNVSSQFVTGLLYALPLLQGNSEIVLATPLESEGYVDMTLEVLEQFGIKVLRRENGWFVPGGQRYLARDVDVEPDWSQAAFWYAAAALGSEVTVQGMNEASAQGDRVIAAQFRQLTAPGDVVLDVSQCPDLVPALAAMAAVRQGTTHITNAARLRIKESDRLAAVTRALNALGGDVTELADGLVIVGRSGLVGGVEVDSCNDHRIAMMAAVAAVRCERPVTVLDAQCVAKSYPGFWSDYEKLGGRILER